jgi:hypothetical protein
VRQLGGREPAGDLAGADVSQGQVAAVEHVGERDLLHRPANIQGDAEVLHHQRQLFDQVVLEHGGAGDGGGVVARQADAGVGATDARIAALPAPVQPKLGIGVGPVEAICRVGTQSVGQEGLQGGPQGRDGTVVFFDKPLDDGGCFFLMSHGCL